MAETPDEQHADEMKRRFIAGKRLADHIYDDYWQKGVRDEKVILEGLVKEGLMIDEDDFQLALQTVKSNYTEHLGEVKVAEQQASLGAPSPTVAPPVREPPVHEIDGYIVRYYRRPDIEKIMKSKYGEGFRPVITDRIKLARENRESFIRQFEEAEKAVGLTQASSQASASVLGAETVSTQGPPDADSAPVDVNAVINELKSLGVEIQASGSVLATPVPEPMSVPYDQRLNNYKKMLEVFRKTGQPFDPSFVAISMGYPDIAAQVKGGSLQSYLTPQMYVSPTSGPASPPADSTGGLPFDIKGIMKQVLYMKMMVPIMNQMASEGFGQQPRDIERIVADAVQKAQGSPEIKALQEQIRAMQGNREIDVLREEMKRLADQGKGESSPEFRHLRDELERLKSQQSQQQQVEQMKIMSDVMTKSGGDMQKMWGEIARLSQEKDKTIEQMRLDNQRLQSDQNNKIELMRIEELRNMQAQVRQLEQSQRAGSGDPIQNYTALSQIIDARVEQINKMQGGKGAAEALPELLTGTVKELAPAFTAYMNLRASQAGARPPTPVPVAAQAAQTYPPAQRTTPPQFIQGTCPWCSQQVQIENKPQTPCPLCGKIIEVPQAPSGTEGPNAPVGPVGPSAPVPQQPTYEMEINGQKVKVRNPDSPFLA